ncbi:MAG: DUF5916 domain-containing protein [Gemmatimonadales bacterium]
MLTFTLLAALQTPATAVQDPAPAPGLEVPGGVDTRVTIPRLDQQVAIDGQLDEPAWQSAVRLTGFHQHRPSDGRPAEERTEVWVWYSPQAIHFGIRAYDRQPETVRATVADRDNLGDDDRVIIFLDTFNDRRRAFFFGVNPLGAQQDGVRSEGSGSAGNLFGASDDLNPDYFWESKGQRTPFGYEVEVRVPFKSLRYPGNGPQTWGLNITRIVQRTGYEDTWTDVRRANASLLAQTGIADGLRDLDRGVVFEAQPFVTASWNGAVDAGGEFHRDDPDPSAGVNLRLGLTNLALDGTVNPDFSTIESDIGLVTVNERFALFVPEKRPFFLEGIELFSTPQQLVYTRRVVDPDGGAKVTGKFGRLGVAWLAAVDGEDQGSPLFNILRVRRDVGSNSLLGFTYTDRTDGSAFNRVAAGDARIVFAKLYFIEGQYGGSWTGEAGGTRSGPLWKLEFDRTGRQWGFNYFFGGVSPDFVTEAGFVNRTDIVSGRAFNRLSWYGAPGASLENFTTFFGFNRVWDYDGFEFRDALEGDDEINLNTTWRGGWRLDASSSREFYTFLPGDYAGYEVDSPGGTVPFTPAAGADGLWVGSIEGITPTFRHWNAALGFQYGAVPIFDEATEGRGYSVEADLQLRPTPSIRVTGSLAFVVLDRLDGSEFARTILPRLKVEYQPTRALFFRVVSEYRTERRSALQDADSGDPILVGGIPVAPQEYNGLRADWLAAFEPVPGTAAYLGYGATMAGGDPFEFGALERQDDGFFLKLSYLIRR